ncbi:MAG: metallophosphoesterase [Vicinamibacterales bacterium]
MTRWRAAAPAALLFLLAIWSAGPRAGSPDPSGSPQRQAPGRVVAIGDIHGSIDGLTGILRTAGLADGRVWTGGNATLVQTGDFTDRGADVRAVMDLLMALEPQATAAGGRVLVLLGNHETMNVLGELRDVTPQIFASFADGKSDARREEAWREYEKFHTARAAKLGAAAPKTLAREAWMAAHPPGFFEYRDAFGPDGTYGKWLRGLPAAAQIDGSIFMHGGIHPDAPPDSIDDISKQVARELRTFDDYSRHLVSRGGILPFFTLQETFDAVQAEAHAIAAAQTAAKNGEQASLAQSQILSDLDRKHIEVLQGIARLGTWAVLNPNGPLWFRGYATWPSPERADDVTKLLKKYKARRFVIGHTVPSTMRITPRFDRRIFLIDTGMLSTHYKGGRASALEIDGDRVTAVYQDGRVPLDPSAQPDGSGGAEGRAVNR